MLRRRWVVIFSLWGALVVGSRPVRAEDAPGDPNPLDGRWQLVDAEEALQESYDLGVPPRYRCELYFWRDGTWGVVRATGKDAVTVTAGRWTREDGHLRLEGGPGEPVPAATWIPQAVVDDQLLVPGELAPGDKERLVRPRWRWISADRMTWERKGDNLLYLGSDDPTGGRLLFLRGDELRADQLTGPWTDGSVVMRFDADGGFWQTRADGGAEARVSGTWEIAWGQIFVRGTDGGVWRSFAPILAGRLHLLWEVERGGRLEHLTLERKGASPAAGDTPPPAPSTEPAPARPTPATPHPSTPSPSPGIVGTWVAPVEGGEARITFREDGTYAREWPEGGTKKRFAGTYEVKGAALVVEDAEEPGTLLKVAFRRIGNDELELTIEGEVLRLSREGAAARGAEPPTDPVPASLHGAWLARDETGSVHLDLTPDGRFVLALENPQQKWRYAGPCGVRGGAVEGRDEATGGPVRLPYRQTDATTLVVTLGEVEFRLKKQETPKAPDARGAEGGSSPEGGARRDGEASKEGGLPPELLGTWSGPLFTLQGFDAGSATVTFKADKTYSLNWRLPGHIIPRAGNYKVTGNVVTMMAKGEGPITVEFRVAGDELTLDAFAAMQPTVLKRQP